jgi:hypothetical protein
LISSRIGHKTPPFDLKNRMNRSDWPILTV